MNDISEQNVIPLKNLLNKRFYIPSYQRGYRWEKEQVIDLLNDIKTFSNNRDPRSKDFYCLQPIVVKENNGTYEVLDGQQRLTTILLILKNIVDRETLVEEYALGEPLDSKLYDIDYVTRPGSSDFLHLGISEMEKRSYDYIDYFYIYQASKEISKWFKDSKSKPEKRSIFDVDFLLNTKVIWYEVDHNEDEIEAFTRLNIGKIELTNAELIKSLFLNSSNFKNERNDIVRLFQIEIANEWDRIEYALQDDELWGFVSPSKNYILRIEYILDLISCKPQDSKDKNFTFREFNRLITTSEINDIKKCWLRVKRYFQTIEDWFKNKELYHKLGYLLAVDYDINKLLHEWENNRINFSKYVKDAIIAKAGGCNMLNNVSVIEYGNGPVKNILLLHNILTICSNENESSRFSFAKFKSEKWDVEHIHATADVIEGDKHREAWLSTTKKYVSDPMLLERMEIYNPSNFQDIYTDVVEYLGHNNNLIGNLCLLDAKTNRGYGCAVYAEKRSIILDKYNHGRFIPLCTLNVFNKFYSSDVENMIIWDDTPQKDYIKHISDTISNFLKD